MPKCFEKIPNFVVVEKITFFLQKYQKFGND